MSSKAAATRPALAAGVALILASGCTSRSANAWHGRSARNESGVRRSTANDSKQPGSTFLRELGRPIAFFAADEQPFMDAFRGLLHVYEKTYADGVQYQMSLTAGLAEMPRVTCRFRDIPLLTALTYVCDSVGLSLHIVADSRILIVSERWVHHVQITHVMPIDRAAVERMGLQVVDGTKRIECVEWFTSRGIPMPDGSGAHYLADAGLLLLTNHREWIDLMVSVVMLEKHGFTVSK